MKNLIKKSLLIVAVFIAITVTATELESGVTLKIDSKLIDLSLYNTDGDLTVRVKDSNGYVLYTERFEGQDYSKKYDLNTLPNGDYFFEIEGQTKIKLVPFKVKSKGVILNNASKTSMFKPIVRQDNSKVYISQLALNSEPLKVVFYDKSYNVLYKEVLNGSVNLEKVLNISKLKKGDYILKMSSNTQSFTKNIRK
tara:strand:+ start:38617 stop:39204 length:588 start_codon:yes stop_codon:yes gene_type:complete